MAFPAREDVKETSLMGFETLSVVFVFEVFVKFFSRNWPLQRKTN